jgi:hypothetical protein
VKKTVLHDDLDRIARAGAPKSATLAGGYALESFLQLDWNLSRLPAAWFPLGKYQPCPGGSRPESGGRLSHRSTARLAGSGGWKNVWTFYRKQAKTLSRDGAKRQPATDPAGVFSAIHLIGAGWSTQR